MYILKKWIALVLLLLSTPSSPTLGRELNTDWQFPSKFLWGVSTSAHQVEGQNSKNDWWEWEQNCHVAHCDQSGEAADHYHRFRQDLDLAQSLGINLYRFSIEWSRIEPSPGVFSLEEIQHYREVLQAAHARGMKTMLTLHHFTLPLWLTHRNTPEKSGWLDPEIPELFGRFTEKVVQGLGDQVDYWNTLNEPTVNALTGYVAGVSPPGLQDIQKAPFVLANFVKAHAKAYRIIQRYQPQALVGFAHHMRVFDPYRSWHPLDQLAAYWIDDFWNHQFIRAMETGLIDFGIPFVFHYSEPYSPELAGSLDFIGVNYYSRDLIAFDSQSPQRFSIKLKAGAPLSEVGWEIYPEGLYRVLKSAYKYGLPLYITENGVADAQDRLRGRFICDHLEQVARALAEGVDIRSYIHWSLIDNFEWSLGWAPQFGLASVDRATQKRTLRPSALVYRDIIQGRSGVCK